MGGRPGDAGLAGRRWFALIGNSFGGYVAQRVAVLAPARVWAMVLVSSPDDALEPSPRLRAAWEAEQEAVELEDFDLAVQGVLDTWTLPSASTRLRMRIGAMQRRAFELQVQDGETPPGPDPLEADPGALARLAIPTLITCGELELPDFQDAARRLAGAIPGARHEVIEAAGHLAPLERPKVFRELALGFLAQARAGEDPT